MDTPENLLPKTILLIESDITEQAAICKLVDEKGHILKIIDKFEDAIVASAVESPDLLIISFDHPTPNEINILKDFILLYSQLPLIIMASSLSKEEIVEIASLKPIDVILKPPNTTRISNRIDEILGVVDKDISKQLDEELCVIKEEILPEGVSKINVNNLIPGQKTAKTVEHKGVIVIEKGTLLTEKHIENLNKYGVENICIYSEPTHHSLSFLPRNGIRGKLQQESKKEKELNRKSTVFKTINRTSIRVPFYSIGEYSIITGEENKDNETNKCMIIDISSGGVGILTQEKLNQNVEILLNFKIDEEFDLKDIKGIIKYTSPFKSEKSFNYKSGISFTSITQKYRENLITKIFELQRKQIKEKKGKRGNLF